MNCEMCDVKEAIFYADVEGAKIKVCENCSRYGKIISKVQTVFNVKTNLFKSPTKSVNNNEDYEDIVDNYFVLIKNARGKLNLTQKELALKLNEKENLLSKVESGNLKPNLDLAKKLEKFLKIKLVEKFKTEAVVSSGSKNDSFTVGDYINK